jgi:hypothetical protein
MTDPHLEITLSDVSARMRRYARPTANHDGKHMKKKQRGQPDRTDYLRLPAAGDGFADARRSLAGGASAPGAGGEIFSSLYPC